MNRRTSTILIVSGILAGALGVTGCGSGSSSGSGGASSSTAEDTTLTVYVKPVQNGIYTARATDVFRINGQGVESRTTYNGVGDTGIYNSTVLGSPTGATVGSATDICTTMDTAGLVHCESSLTLDNKGTLFVAANFIHSDPTQTFAITGGTGVYDESRGQVSVAQGSGDESVVKIDID